jgi:hypothetical protein
VKVGLYYELRVPPGSGQVSARVYAHTLETCEEAEQAGIDSVWLTEHHQFDYGYRVPGFELFSRMRSGRFEATGDCVRQLWGPGGITPRPVQPRCRSG